MDKTQVVFVGGYGRSGSTIIDVLLNRVPSIVAVGEFRHLFGRALGDNELCSCSQPFRECPFWGKVLAEAFPDGVDPGYIQHVVQRWNRVVRLPFLRFPRLMTPRMREEAQVYHEAFAAAYHAVAKVSGAKVVVDSTKYPVHGWFLSTMPELDLRVMLLVRDPRAVAFSWTRRRLRPEVHWEKREMPRHNVVRSAQAWNMSNDITARLAWVRKLPCRLQRYEDFVANPTEELVRIASFALGEHVTLPADLFTRQPHLPHTIAGNPLRIGSEHVRVHEDDEWKQMPWVKRLAIILVSWPGMLRYHYSLRIDVKDLRRPAAVVAISSIIVAVALS
ncbi:MAG TPA: sulfotransferase [Candidatus Saccharimonadales bacterium]|nr:sulfotransferase [Candidatus Saccharimonadales bacterium]